MRRGNRTVAVKLLNTVHEDKVKQEFFRRETRSLEQLEHPNPRDAQRDEESGEDGLSCFPKSNVVVSESIFQ